MANRMVAEFTLSTSESTRTPTAAAPGAAQALRNPLSTFVPAGGGARLRPLGRPRQASEDGTYCRNSHDNNPGGFAMRKFNRKILPTWLLGTAVGVTAMAVAPETAAYGQAGPRGS